MTDHDGDLHRSADVFEVLSNPRRLRILHILMDGERAVGEICSRVDLNQPSVSRHLRKMDDRGVVERRKQGVNAYYSISDERVVDLVTIGQSLTERPAGGEQPA